jgi:hypothetical protein
MRVAEDRARWREVGEAYVQHLTVSELLMLKMMIVTMMRRMMMMMMIMMMTTTIRMRMMRMIV